jgi:hypothetical protein
VVAAVDRALVILSPVLGPFHRAPGGLGAERDDGLVGVERNLAPEPAAHLRRDDPHLMLGDAGHDRHQKPGNVGVLGRVPDGQIARTGVELRDHSSGFERIRDQPLVDEPLREHDPPALGLPERRGRGLRVAERPGKGKIAGHVGVDLGGAPLHRLLLIDHRGQRLVLHAHERDGVPRGVPAFGDDHRNSVAGVANGVHGERRVRRSLQV